jgi:hypothetical protein
MVKLTTVEKAHEYCGVKQSNLEPYKTGKKVRHFIRAIFSHTIKFRYILVQPGIFSPPLVKRIAIF